MHKVLAHACRDLTKPAHGQEWQTRRFARVYKKLTNNILIAAAKLIERTQVSWSAVHDQCQGVGHAHHRAAQILGQKSTLDHHRGGVGNSAGQMNEVCKVLLPEIFSTRSV